MELYVGLKLLLAVVVLRGVLLVERDPYSILEVRNSAGGQEIKQAYKRLARRWHPDKSTDPIAQEKFMDISWAYEILSDDTKRQEFDRYGTVGGGARSNGHPFHNAFHHNQGAFHSFPFGGTADRDYASSMHRTLTLHYYTHTVLPRSNTKAFLVYVYGNWCYECVRMASRWEHIASELEAVGVEVCQVNADHDGAVAAALGIRRYPAILVIVRGRNVRYRKPIDVVSVVTMRDFIEAQLPRGIVSTITSELATEYFRAAFSRNQPQVVLFTPKQVVPLLYQLLAFEFNERVSFAYVNSKDSQTTTIRRRYHVNAVEPKVVICKEEPSTPELVLESSQLKHGALREAVTANQFLRLPRISSEPLFDDLCPVSHPSDPRLCVVLFTSSGADHSGHRYQLRLLAKSEVWTQKHVQFLYVNEDVQHDFSGGFVPRTELDNCGSEEALNVAVLSRESMRNARFDWFQGGWCGGETYAASLREELEVMLLHVIDRKTPLIHTIVLNRIKNEYGPTPFQNAVSYVYGVVQWTVDAFDATNWQTSSIGSLVFVLALVIVFSIAMPIVSDQSRGSAGPHRPSPSRDDQIVLGMVKLSPANEMVLVDKAKPGSMTIVLLLTSDTGDAVAKSPLMQAFADVTYSYTWNSAYTFCWLSLSEQLLWCTEVMQVNQFGEILPGTVLAINGRRKYVYIFRPAAPQSDKERLRSDGVGADFLGLEDSSDGEGVSTRERDNERLVCIANQLRLELPTWLERLYEGTLGKKKIMDAWPRMESTD